MGLAWALKKNSFYLQGQAPFTVLTDCKSLAGLESKPLDATMSSRVWHIMELMLCFNLQVRHVSAKENLVADYLSWLSHTSSEADH